MASRRRVNADSNLGRSDSRVRKLAAAGLIPAVRDANGHYWYPTSIRSPDHPGGVRRGRRGTSMIRDEGDGASPTSHQAILEGIRDKETLR
jgi:hypothetical protein